MTVQLPPQRAGWTYGEILDYFAKRMDDDSDRTRETNRLSMRDVILDISSRYNWSWLKQNSTFQSQIGLAEYVTDPTATRPIGNMFINNVATIRHVPLIELREHASRYSDTGIPSEYAKTGESGIILFKMPAAIYTVSYDYEWVVPLEIEDDLRPPWSAQFDHLLLRGLEEKFRMDDDRIDAATRMAGGRFQQSLNQMIFWDTMGELETRDPDIASPSSPESRLGHSLGWRGR